MTAFLDIRVAVSDDEFKNFILRLASSPVAISATDEDGEELSTAPVGEVDKFGIPWLESVHAGTKTQTKDGRWKRLKGVTEEQRDAAELAYKQANPTPTGPAAVQAVFAAPTVPGLPVVPGAPVASQPVYVPQTATAPTPPAVNPAPASVTIPPQVPGAPAAVAAPVIPGMTPPAPVVPVVVEDKPVTLDDVGTAFSNLQAKYGDLPQEFVDSIYSAAKVSNPNDIVNDESARKRVIETITLTLAQNS